MSSRPLAVGLTLAVLAVGAPVAAAVTSPAAPGWPQPRPAVRRLPLHRTAPTTPTAPPTVAPGSVPVPVVAPAPGTDRVVVRRLDLGGSGALRGWAPEHDTTTTVSGGSVAWDAAPLDLSRAKAPADVYRSERWGDQTVTVTGLVPGAPLVLRLHLEEPVHDTTGARVFDVDVNGVTVLPGVDVVAMAGGAHRPVAPELAVRADAGGRLVVHLRGRRDAATLQGLEVLWDQSTAGTTLFPAGRTTRVMALGDSITWGYTDEAEGGFRLPLWDAMAARGWSFEPVGPVAGPPWGGTSRWAASRHASWNGWTIDDVLGSPTASLNDTGQRLEDWLTTYRPDVLLVHLGNNDVEQGEDRARMAREIGELLDRAHAASPQAHVLVARVIDQQTRTTQVTRFDEDVASAVMARSARGWPVHLVDQESAVDSSSLYADYSHPTRDGYHRMAQAWLRALVAVSR